MKGPKIITDEELCERIALEGNYIRRLSRVSEEMREFEEWASGAIKILSGSHTGAQAAVVLAEWKSRRAPLSSRIGGWRGAFRRRRGDVVLTARVDELEGFDSTELRRAENGSEMLYGLARHLEAAGADVYARQVRNSAYAVHQIASLHPAAGGTDVDGMAAKEHSSQIAHRLRLHSNRDERSSD